MKPYHEYYNDLSPRGKKFFDWSSIVAGIIVLALLILLMASCVSYKGYNSHCPTYADRAYPWKTVYYDPNYNCHEIWQSKEATDDLPGETIDYMGREMVCVEVWYRGRRVL